MNANSSTFRYHYTPTSPTGTPMAHDMMADDSRIRRMRLTGMQVDLLNEVFENEPQPPMDTRAALADQLGMEIKQISSWFQNRRQKLKSTSSVSPPPSFFHSPTTTISPNTTPYAQPLQSTFQLPPPPAVPTYPGVTHTGHRIINTNTKTKEEPTEHHTNMFQPSPSPTLVDVDAGVPHHITLAHRTPRKTTRSARLASSPIPVSHPHSHSPQTTTSRARMSSDQRAILQDFWTRTTQPTMDERALIAQTAKMSVPKVTNWFRNLRQSERKKAMALERERVRKNQGHGREVHMHMEDGESDSASDEEGDEVVTPWNSPDTKYEHSFRGTSECPAHHHIGPKVEDALLLLYFTQNCGLEDKNMGTNMKGRSLFV